MKMRTPLSLRSKPYRNSWQWLRPSPPPYRLPWMNVQNIKTLLCLCIQITNALQPWYCDSNHVLIPWTIGLTPLCTLLLNILDWPSSQTPLCSLMGKSQHTPHGAFLFMPSYGIMMITSPLKKVSSHIFMDVQLEMHRLILSHSLKMAPQTHSVW